MVSTTSPAPRPATNPLALLDAAALTDAVATAFPAARAVGPARVEYLDLVPGERLVVQARADVDGAEQDVVVRSSAPFRPADAVVHRLRDDPALPLLRSGARLLAYVPGRRATLGVRPYVVKTYADDREFRAAATAMRLLADGADLPTPPAVAVLPLHRATLQRHVEGSATDVRGALDAAVPAGRILARLHASTRTATGVRRPEHELASARRAVGVLAEVLPGEAARARRLLDALAADLPTHLPVVLSHGDFTVDQLLRTPDGGLVVTDVDTACQAPAALDVATFAANVVSGRPGDDDRGAAVLDRLLSAHGRPPGLRWYLTVALLRRCDRPFRRLKKRWPEKSASILDAAQKASS